MPLEIFKILNDSVKGHGAVGIYPNLKSYITFIEIFKKSIKVNLATYEAMLSKISQILSRIRAHFESSAQQVVSLEKMKEQSKASIQEYQVWSPTFFELFITPCPELIDTVNSSCLPFGHIPRHYLDQYMYSSSPARTGPKKIGPNECEEVTEKCVMGHTW